MTRFHPIPYTCKICGRPGTAQADLACDPDEIDIFAKCLCCNICSDAREKSQKAEKRIYSACHFLIHINEFREQEKIRTRARESLYKSTKLYAESQCERWRISTVWELDFVEQLMRTPEKVSEVLQFYRDSLTPLKKMAEQ